jgi:hypothetical protein
MTDIVFEANAIQTSICKGFPEGLKGLQSSKMSRRNFFNFLAEINIDELYGKKENIIYGETKPAEPTITIIDNSSKPTQLEVETKLETESESDTISKDRTDEEPSKEAEVFKCGACMKMFSTKGSLKRHQDRFTVCKEWIDLPQKIEINKLTKGIHLIIDELLDKSISDGDLECKFCKAKFTTKGNHHKHFNSATVCNRMAYQEFKKLFNNL